MVKLASKSRKDVPAPITDNALQIEKKPTVDPKATKKTTKKTTKKPMGLIGKFL